MLAVVVALTAIVGVVLHVHGNYEAGPLDFRYSQSWASMPEWSRWLAAVTETVGPSPPVAPGVLAQVGLAVLIATVCRPALAAPAAGVAGRPPD